MLDLQKIIGDLKASGIGVLITDHNVRETLSVTDRAYIIEGGRIFRHGSRSNWPAIQRCGGSIWERVSRWCDRKRPAQICPRCKVVTTDADAVCHAIFPTRKL